MRFFSCFAGSGILLGLFALLACTSAGASGPSKSLAVSSGEKFSVSLKSNPTTGYHWQLAQPLNDKIVRFVDKNYTPAASDGRVGGGGTEVWTFEATGKGSAQIPMVYVRPWEKNVVPSDSTTFQVNVR